jgi:hypothetical protein
MSTHCSDPSHAKLAAALASALGQLVAEQQKWRDRANEPEYKSHREWAIDECADSLAPIIAILEGAK